MEVTHPELVDKAKRWLLSRNCTVVLTELITGGLFRESPDAWGWNTGKNCSFLVECKASRADFRSDLKSKWFRNPRFNSGMGAYRWYLAPMGMIHEKELPKGWGLLEVQSTGGVVQIVESKRFKWSAQREMGFLTSAVRRFHLPDRGVGLRAYSAKMYGKPSDNPKATLTVEQAEEVTA